MDFFFSRKFYVPQILMFKNYYLVCFGSQLDEFNGNLIVSLGFLICNYQRTKYKWQIVINNHGIFSFDCMWNIILDK